MISGSGRKVGKTLLGTSLVSELVRRGARVSVVKHVHHGVDYRVKDTGRYLEAGATRVVAVGDSEYMIVARGVIGFDEILNILAGSDIVVVEGFKSHAGMVLEKGGCVVYLGGNLSGISVNERIVIANINELDQVLGKVLELLERGLCRVGQRASQ